MISRIKSFYHKHSFRKETYYQLNHFTLEVKNPELKREIAVHHAQQIARILKLWAVVEISTLLSCLYYHFLTPVP